MPKYFRMSSLSSFQRQINLYNFKRITEGVDKGAYYHELFLRGKGELTKNLKRVKCKKATTNACGFVSLGGMCPTMGQSLGFYEPDFYSMPSMSSSALTAGKKITGSSPATVTLLGCTLGGTRL
uniref:HSF-type DNA-binding domain-containing protein n=1 Tax=Odontella aurita TaxID=265563 RepID=A0A7S4K4X2_9STRA